jgi:putative hydrolase of HD superfamily
MENAKNIVNFLFEVGSLSKTPRSGFHMLRTGKQSVAEHTNRAVFIGYTLAMLDGQVDVGKVMKICLFHDLAESRVSDLNYVNLKYVEKSEIKAIDELAGGLPFGADIQATFDEYQKKEIKEALYAKDADILEWILSLKEQADIGNSRANGWIEVALKRLRTELGKKLAEEILKTDSLSWSHGNLEDSWWVNRNQT